MNSFMNVRAVGAFYIRVDQILAFWPAEDGGTHYISQIDPTTLRTSDLSIDTFICRMTGQCNA